MNDYSNSADLISTDNRTAFINKVFIFFGMAILIAAIGAYLGAFLFAEYTELMLSPVMTWGPFIALLALTWTSHTWHDRPIGYVLFGLLALLSGFITTPLLLIAGIIGGGMLIMKALVVTSCVFGASAIFGWITDKDMSTWGGMLSTGVLSIFVISLLNVFLFKSNVLSMTLDVLCICVFTVFTAYDIQMIKSHYPDHLYLLAAINLYLNFLNLFRAILSLLISFNRE